MHLSIHKMSHLQSFTHIHETKIHETHTFFISLGGALATFIKNDQTSAPKVAPAQLFLIGHSQISNTHGISHMHKVIYHTHRQFFHYKVIHRQSFTITHTHTQTTFPLPGNTQAIFCLTHMNS